MKLYVVILEDRHIDVQVEVFSDKTKAMTQCWELARQDNSHPEDIEDIAITRHMEKLGWILCLNYSCEGDSCRVVGTELVE